MSSSVIFMKTSTEVYSVAAVIFAFGIAVYALVCVKKGSGLDEE